MSNTETTQAGDLYTTLLSKVNLITDIEYTLYIDACRWLKMSSANGDNQIFETNAFIIYKWSMTLASETTFGILTVLILAFCFQTYPPHICMYYTSMFSFYG